MILAEKEARKIMCPLLSRNQEQKQLCLGAGCMFWRFKNPERRKENDPGYCGIAGKPMGAM